MRERRRRAALVVALVSVVGAFPARAAPAVDRVEVHAGSAIGPSNPRLGGVGWNAGALDPVAPLRPPFVRIDASLEHASPAPGQLALGPLLDRVAAVRRIGAEPLVILSYMPAWLASHGGAPDPRDPTRVRPRDLDAWQALVHDVVLGLATAPEPAHRFEVWNEPDWPAFWQDSQDAFLALALRTHTAVAAVARETGLALEVGGPATLVPDPAWIVPYAEAVRSAGLPLDFVSWHWYGNYPFIGPDGAEDPRIEPVHPILGRPNPATSPGAYGTQTAQVRAWTDAALAGSGLAPRLVIDEWNLSAGGLDRRHDTSVGAAFAAASLIAMEDAGLDEAAFYRAADAPGAGHDGDWGLVDAAGEPKPVWWVFHAWRATAGERVELDGVPDGLFARATRRPGSVDVLLAAFDAARDREPQELELSVSGVRCRGAAEVRVLEGQAGDLARGRTVSGRDTVRLRVESPSVTWVTFHGCTRGAR